MKRLHHAQPDDIEKESDWKAFKYAKLENLI